MRQRGERSLPPFFCTNRRSGLALPEFDGTWKGTKPAPGRRGCKDHGPGHQEHDGRGFRHRSGRLCPERKVIERKLRPIPAERVIVRAARRDEYETVDPRPVRIEERRR